MVFANKPALSVELIENGSFEAPNGNPDRTGWDDAPGIGNDRGFGDREHAYVLNGSVEGGVPVELPPGALDPEFTGIVGPAGAGQYYAFRWGFGNGSGFQGSATQIISLFGYNGLPYNFSAWLASRIDDPDYPLVTLNFYSGLDAAGDLLGSAEFNGDDQMSPLIVGSLGLEGMADPSIPATQDNWTLYRATGEIPISAQSAAVTIRSGLDIYGYVDLVSLQVIPEPSSAVLAGLFGAVGVVWCVRRKSGAPRA